MMLTHEYIIAFCVALTIPMLYYDVGHCFILVAWSTTLTFVFSAHLKSIVPGLERQFKVLDNMPGLPRDLNLI